MELDANGLVLLIILGIAFWKFGQVLEDLKERASRQLHQSAIVQDNAIKQNGMPARAVDGLDRAPSNRDDGPNDRLARRLADIRLADRTFDVTWFLDSARVVYETVIAAFAHGDRDLLKDLLGPNVYDVFASDIAAREARGEHVEHTFVSLKRADIVDADVADGLAQITVAFESELVVATRDPAGKVVAGDPVHVIVASDLWTFAKDFASRSPVWKLAATESPAGPQQQTKQEQVVCQLDIA